MSLSLGALAKECGVNSDSDEFTSLGALHVRGQGLGNNCKMSMYDITSWTDDVELKGRLDNCGEGDGGHKQSWRSLNGTNTETGTYHFPDYWSMYYFFTNDPCFNFRTEGTAAERHAILKQLNRSSNYTQNYIHSGRSYSTVYSEQSDPSGGTYNVQIKDGPGTGNYSDADWKWTYNGPANGSSGGMVVRFYSNYD